MKHFFTSRNNFTFLAITLVMVSITVSNCKKDSQFIEDEPPSWYFDLAVPVIPYNYENPGLPSFFYSRQIVFADNTPADNPTTNWGATLGRVLFYDKRLSINNTISCSSCHQQEFGFSDTARLSKGFNHGLTGRHSMGLVNAKYYSSGKFFWDERASSLEDQVLQPIQDAIEMGMTIDSVISKLQKIDYYPDLFTKAFGDNQIDSVRLSKALSQFVRSLVSYQSKFDVGRSRADSFTQQFANFTPSENRGKTIFTSKGTLTCSGCHITDVFIGDNPRNNGMNIAVDSGVGAVSNNPMDLFTFKTPSLKNIAVRPPYMHNGAFGSLEAVINHYSDSIADHAFLDPHFRTPNGQNNQFNLTAQEKTDLINFLKTLTDEKMLKDKKFNDPFL